MPIRINRADALHAYPPRQRDEMFPEWAGDDDPQLGITPAAGECHPRVEIHYNTDFAVVATDGTEIDEVIKAAEGMLGAVGAPSPTTLINGIKASAQAIGSVLGEKSQQKMQEFSFNAIPCVEKPHRFKVSLEVYGWWLVNDPDARFDADEKALVSLTLRAAGATDEDGWSHAKATRSVVSFPIPRKDGHSVRFKVEVTTPPVAKPFKVYASLIEQVSTNGPGNSALNPVDLLEDLFTNAMSAIHIGSVFFVIEDAHADAAGQGD